MPSNTRAGHPVDAPDHDRPLGVARLGAGHEGVSEHDAADRPASREVGSDAVARRSDDRLVRPRQRLPRAGQRNSRVVGVEVGDAVDGSPHAVTALEQQRQVEGARGR